jgi:hypothetical protein
VTPYPNRSHGAEPPAEAAALLALASALAIAVFLPVRMPFLAKLGPVPAPRG